MQTLLYSEAFKHKRLYTRTIIHQSFHAQIPLHGSLYTQNFCTQQVLDRAVFTRSSFLDTGTNTCRHRSIDTHRSFTCKPLHGAALIPRSHYVEKQLHRAAFTRKRFSDRSFDTPVQLEACTHKPLSREKPLHTRPVHTGAFKTEKTIQAGFRHEGRPCFTRKIAIARSDPWLDPAIVTLQDLSVKTGF